MLVAKAIRIDYRKLNPNCAYCDRPSTVIRVTALNDGSIMVASLCEKDHLGEVDHCLEEGMRMAGESSLNGTVTDSTLIDESALKALLPKLKT